MRDKETGMKIEPVKNISKSFLYCMDISSLICMEDAGFRFFDKDRSQDDFVNILKGAGVNTIRVKLWNDPYDEQGRGYGGGNSDIKKAVAIAERAKKAGLKFILDFHYSDFWSDPGRQLAPKAWAGFNLEEKAKALHDFTVESMMTILETGVDLAIVQIGNEINHGIADEHEFKEKCVLLNAGMKAVDEVNARLGASVLKAVHFTDPDKGFDEMCDYLKKYGVDYDVFGCSFYATWHGSSHCLAPSLKHIAQTYGKKVMILETAWPHDMPPAELIYTYGFTDFDVSVDGQIEFMRDVVEQLAKLGDDAIGISYWEPAWLNTTRDEWNRFGTGWASEYAGTYDECAKGMENTSGVDEQSLVYADGHDVYPLESLCIYNMIKGEDNESGA